MSCFFSLSFLYSTMLVLELCQGSQDESPPSLQTLCVFYLNIFLNSYSNCVVSKTWLGFVMHAEPLLLYVCCIMCISFIAHMCIVVSFSCLVLVLFSCLKIIYQVMCCKSLSNYIVHNFFQMFAEPVAPE